MTNIPSADGVEIALHELAGTPGDDHTVVLFAHATGFHGRAYLPVAEALAPQLHSFGADLRGHGDSVIAPGWEVDWERYGEDVLAVTEHLARLPGGADGVVGVGHSMGGGALLMAAHAAARLFRLLVLFEPIVLPTDLPSKERRPQSQLPAGSRRRRETFPSIDAAIENFAAKPPMRSFAPAALDAYVRFGFGDDPETAGVRLKCDREHEARTFEQGGMHRTWDLLPAITVPTVVVAGAIADHQPSAMAEAIAERMPAGRFVEVPELDHFGPMTDPGRFAALIVDAAGSLAA